MSKKILKFNELKSNNSSTVKSILENAIDGLRQFDEYYDFSEIDFNDGIHHLMMSYVRWGVRHHRLPNGYHQEVINYMRDFFETPNEEFLKAIADNMFDIQESQIIDLTDYRFTVFVEDDENSGFQLTFTVSDNNKLKLNHYLKFIGDEEDFDDDWEDFGD